MTHKERMPQTRHGRWMSEECESGLVSVILATYNRAGLLVEAMDSVWAQSYRPIELLIIDDGSTDMTREVVDNWSRGHGGDSGFHLCYFHQENARLSAARNLGLIESHGEYIQFLDSDDLLHPQRLARIVDAFKESLCDFVYTGYENFCVRCGETIGRRIPEAGGDPLDLFCQGRLYVNSLLMAWRRTLMIKVGPWDEDLLVSVDIDYAIRVLLTSRRGKPIQDVLARARRGGSDNMTNMQRTLKGYECRLHCQTMLCDGIKDSSVSRVARKSLASSLYSTGIFVYPNFPDLGRQFGELAEDLGYGPSGIVGWRLRTIWRAGRYVCAAYLFAVRAKDRSWPRGGSAAHKCQNTKLFRKKRPI